MATSTSKAMGSLIDLLLDFVDTARVHDQNYDIAQGLLRHYAELGSMSLRQMADACYVSPASLSRFCRFVGFSGFAEFKEAIDGAGYQVTDDYTRSFYNELMGDKTRAVETYRSTVVDVLSGALTAEDQQVIDEVIGELEGANRIAYFSHHFLWHIGRYFQGKMLPLGRYVEMRHSYEYQKEMASGLGEGDLAIICSMNGSFFSHYRELVGRVVASGAKIVVLTQNRFAMDLNHADYVLFCGSSNANDVGKYAALLTTDYLVMSYLRRLKIEENSL